MSQEVLWAGWASVRGKCGGKGSLPASADPEAFSWHLLGGLGQCLAKLHRSAYTPNVNIQGDNPRSTVSYCEYPSVLNYWKYYFCLCENPQEFQFKKQPSLTSAHHGPTATDCAAPEGLLTSSSWRYPDCGSWCSDSGGDDELCLLLCASALEAVLVTAGVASSQLSLAFYLVK